MRSIIRFLPKLVNARFLYARVSVVCAVLALIFSASGFAMTLDRVAAKVGSEIITLSSVIERSQAEIARGMRSGKKDIPRPEEIMPKILDLLIDDKLQVIRAKKLGLTVDEASIKDALDDIKKKNNLTDEQLETMLQSENSSIEIYKGTIKNQILISKVVGYEVINRIIVSKRELKKFYRVNQKEFWSPDKVHARHILFILDENLTSEEKQLKIEKANKVLRDLRAGKKFEKLAELHSEDLSASSGGDLGFLEKGQMVPEFEKTAFTLREGEVSDIVKSPFGLHIIKVEKIIPGNTKPFSEVKDKIQNLLRNQKGKKDFVEWMAELRAETFVEKLMFKESPGKKAADLKKKKVRKGSRISSKKKRAMGKGISNSSSKSKVKDDVASSVTNGHAEDDSVKAKLGLAAIKKKLAYYKKLRDSKKISEEDYQKKKRQLLKQI